MRLAGIVGSQASSITHQERYPSPRSPQVEVFSSHGLPTALILYAPSEAENTLVSLISKAKTNQKQNLPVSSCASAICPLVGRKSLKHTSQSQEQRH